MTLQRRATIPADLLSEAEFTTQVVALARLGGWLRYHTHRSKHSPAGFPDEVLVRGPRLIFAELKREGKASKVTPKQQEWLDALGEVSRAVARAADVLSDEISAAVHTSVEVYLWRPSDLEEIARVLTGREVA